MTIRADNISSVQGQIVREMQSFLLLLWQKKRQCVCKHVAVFLSKSMCAWILWGKKTWCGNRPYLHGHVYVFQACARVCTCFIENKQ